MSLSQARAPFSGDRLMAAIPLKPTQPPSPRETLEDRFRRLAATWRDATAHLSSKTAASSHPAYQEIIGLGPPVVPLLLRDLEENQAHWFIALRQITGAQPIPPSAASDIRRMVEAWLCWGKDSGSAMPSPGTPKPAAGP
jgi:hypothetical protein